MCDCDIDIMPQFFSVSTPRARKEHRCYECKSVIHIGENYECANGKWDAGMQTFKTCNSCIQLREKLLKEDECFCPAFGELLVDAQEYVRYDDWEPGFKFSVYRKVVARNKYIKELRK